jgi:DNA-binding MarR family transcriptional regulator
MTTEEKLQLDHQLCFPLYACARRVVGQYTPYLKPLGITYTQYIVLLVLWEQDGLSVGDLCRKLYLDSGTITPLLKKMEEHGLIRRVRSHDDERVVVTYLTDEGRLLKESVRDLPDTIGCCIHLTPEEIGTLYTLLYKVLETM